MLENIKRDWNRWYAEEKKWISIQLSFLADKPDGKQKLKLNKINEKHRDQTQANDR